MRDIHEIGDRPLRVRSDTRQVDGHDSQIWERLSWRKSLKLPSYARWPWEVDRLLIHEFGHQYSGDHLSSDYHEALCRLGAAFKRLALEKPDVLRQYIR